MYLPSVLVQASKAMFHGCVFEADLVGMEHALWFEDVAVRHVLQETARDWRRAMAMISHDISLEFASITVIPLILQF